MRSLYRRWWDAMRDERCTWSCGRAREDICRCRCAGKYHGVYHDELMKLPINRDRKMAAA